MEKLVDIPDVDESRVSSAWNAIVPLAVLVGAEVLYRGVLASDPKASNPDESIL